MKAIEKIVSKLSYGFDRIQPSRRISADAL